MARPSAALVAAEGVAPSGASPSPVSLARVPFHGGHLLAVAGPVDQEGARLVPLRPFCERLGLDPDTQARKLRGKAWACTVIMTVQIPGDDQTRGVACLPLRALPMWLATINPGKVAPDARPMLEAYQAEACDVLYRHFLGGANQGAQLDPSLARTISGKIADLEARVSEQRAQIRRLQDHKRRTLTRSETTALRYRLKHLEELQAFAIERNVKPAKVSPPPPELTEHLISKVWQAIERLGRDRFTAGQIKVKARGKRIGRTNDTAAALAALVARGRIAPTDAKHGRAYLVLAAPTAAGVQ